MSDSLPVTTLPMARFNQKLLIANSPIAASGSTPRSSSPGGTWLDAGARMMSRLWPLASTAQEAFTPFGGGAALARSFGGYAHDQRAAEQVAAVQRRDGARRVLAVGHGHEAEAAWHAAVAVAHHDAVGHHAELTEGGA